MNEGNTATKDLSDYGRAMVAGNYLLCEVIEKRHGLHGYPPQLVGIGLEAAAAGRDAISAVEAFINSSAAGESTNE